MWLENNFKVCYDLRQRLSSEDVNKMDGKIETQYPYLSDYLFLNLLNTTKRQRSKRLDFLVDGGGVREWLKLMQQLELLDS